MAEGDGRLDVFIAIMELMGQVFIYSITTPIFLGVYLLLFVLVCWQYGRLEEVTRSLFNYSRKRYVQSALVSAGLGLVGGLLGSVLLVFIGIDLGGIGIMYLWVLALLLMFIHPRYLCFAYAGGILALISLFTGFPAINIAQLMGLIAVLHMVESILIWLNGNVSPIPVYLQREGRVRGGFNLQYFWPIPLIALMSLGVAEPGGGINMPAWWPLIKDDAFADYELTYTMLPVLAILGYGEVCSTCSPGQRAKKSARNLFLFSLTLLLLAVICSRWQSLTIVAALFSPLGHEFVIWLGLREESRRPPLYVKSARGLMVLDVKAASSAGRSGLRSRDIILNVNGEPLSELHEIQAYLESGFRELGLEVLRDNRRLRLDLACLPGQELGIIPVPKENGKPYLSLPEESLFELPLKLWHRLKNLR